MWPANQTSAHPCSIQKETKENDNRKTAGSYCLSLSSLGSVWHRSAEIQLGILKCRVLCIWVLKLRFGRLQSREKPDICTCKSFFDRLQRRGQYDVSGRKSLHVRLQSRTHKEICGNRVSFPCQIQFDIFETRRTSWRQFVHLKHQQISTRLKRVTLKMKVCNSSIAASLTRFD